VHHESGLGAQAKLELLHDTRQAFGRSTLVLQGGAIFGLCHLGVIKALHLRGLLPRIITGTATGALIAALVGIHTEDELLTFLNGDGIDLTAFDRRNSPNMEARKEKAPVSSFQTSWFYTVMRRVRRYIREGYFLDVNVLEDCVRANVGDLTFEEAYAKSKRILNITVATSRKGGFPSLLNYLTAPNVVSDDFLCLFARLLTDCHPRKLIWSAAMASNASSTAFYSPVRLYCKDETGVIVQWPNSLDITFRSWRQTSYNDRESPLSRIAELFNVNHFIISQARPYLIPFLQSGLQRPGQSSWDITRPILRLVLLEIRHRLKQLDLLGLLPTSLRRLLVDESIPGPGLMLIPDLSSRDLAKLLQPPTKEGLEYWILRGERSVWPAISALKVRCAIEVELDKGYQLVRRRRPSEVSIGENGQRRRSSDEGITEKRRFSS
jgi:TAG lipase/lysophosphatidylethanolamine acyltransferase